MATKENKKVEKKREDQTLTNLDQAKSAALKEKEPLQSVYLKNVNQYLKVQKNAN